MQTNEMQKVNTDGPVSAPLAAPLYGLVLVGGRSRRMGHDKNAIAYRGRPHAQFTAQALEAVCERVFYSCREDQMSNPLFHEREKICDSVEGMGPLGGILSAQKLFPDAAFLVAACDLPFLDQEELKHLLLARNQAKMATVFWNTEKNFPEPLCAIYEPGFKDFSQRYWEAGGRCPRDILSQADLQRVELNRPHALTNANHPDDFQKMKLRLENPGNGSKAAGPRLKLNLLYLSVFRQHARRSSEEFLTTLQTGEDVYSELKLRYRFPLSVDDVHLAINEEYAPWDKPLKDGDTLAFIAPVSGG